MAIMHPSSIESHISTDSEKLFFKALKEQLPDKFHVFYSVVWFDSKDGVRQNSECDFLVYNPDFGFITIEVKGGKGIEIVDGEWRIIYKHASQDNDVEYRILKRSPYLQAQESMYYFKEYFEAEFGYRFSGVFGSAVAFPFYNVSSSLGSEGPREVTIDLTDMNNLSNKINEIFHYHKGSSRNFVFFSVDERKKFIDLVNKRISLSAAAGSLIDMKERQLAEINRIQNNYIDFISSYNQAFIVGGAGTGKTWVGIKKAKILETEGKKVLFVCYNRKLIDFIKKTASSHDIDFYTFDGLVYDILGESKYRTLKQRDNSLTGIFDNINFDRAKKYDAIIVDEAQDFAEEWAITLRSLLRDERNSVLYVFYDKEQNIFNRDFSNGFLIDAPPFYLKENIRNTASIYKWAVEQTGYGALSFANTIEGASPEISKIKTKNNVKRHLNTLLNRLIKHEFVSNQSVTILSNRRKDKSALDGVEELGSFIITEKDRWETNENEVAFSTLQSFKGLESDVVIYLDHHSRDAEDVEIRKRQQYIAYTRARFYLYVIEVEGDY